MLCSTSPWAGHNGHLQSGQKLSGAILQGRVFDPPKHTTGFTAASGPLDSGEESCIMRKAHLGRETGETHWECSFIEKSMKFTRKAGDARSAHFDLAILSVHVVYCSLC